MSKHSKSGVKSTQSKLTMSSKDETSRKFFDHVAKAISFLKETDGSIGRNIIDNPQSIRLRSVRRSTRRNLPLKSKKSNNIQKCQSDEEPFSWFGEKRRYKSRSTVSSETDTKNSDCSVTSMPQSSEYSNQSVNIDASEKSRRSRRRGKRRRYRETSSTETSGDDRSETLSSHHRKPLSKPRPKPEGEKKPPTEDTERPSTSKASEHGRHKRKRMYFGNNVGINIEKEGSSNYENEDCVCNVKPENCDDSPEQED